MRRLPILIAAGLLAGPALAQEPDWSSAAQVTVTLSSFEFDPATVHLRAGQPVTLHLVNESSGGHNFASPDFFAAATIRTEDKGLVYKGAIDLTGHQSKDIRLVPAAGHYKLRCTHTMHAMFGMTGEIVVD
jgi:plastocyanin